MGMQRKVLLFHQGHLS